MKVTLLATLFTGLLALSPAHAGTIDLLSVWSADKGQTSGGVDENAGNAAFGDGVIDQFFPDSCTTCVVLLPQFALHLLGRQHRFSIQCVQFILLRKHYGLPETPRGTAPRPRNPDGHS